jgi:two-component system C4-dicarboxylate transport response regulator DctD
MSGHGRIKHILVVDDEPLVSESIKLLLEDDDYIVHQVESGYLALAMFAEGRYDMIFTDYCMPEMRGDKFAAAIKRMCPKQPVVMITAFPEKFQSSANALGGVDSFICKPFDANVLRTTLARYAPA